MGRLELPQEKLKKTVTVGLEHRIIELCGGESVLKEEFARLAIRLARKATKTKRKC